MRFPSSLTVPRSPVNREWTESVQFIESLSILLICALTDWFHDKRLISSWEEQLQWIPESVSQLLRSCDTDSEGYKVGLERGSHAGTEVGDFFRQKSNNKDYKTTKYSSQLEAFLPGSIRTFNSCHSQISYLLWTVTSVQLKCVGQSGSTLQTGECSH